MNYIHRRMNDSWIDALSLWWSFTWRMLGFAVIGGIIIGLVVTPIAGEQPLVSFLSGLLFWFPISVFTIKLAVESFTRRPQSWGSSIAYWWSFTWRLFLYSVVVGFLAGLIVPIFVGKGPSQRDHSVLGLLLLGYFLSLGPIAIIAFRGVATVHSIRPAAKGDAA